MNFIKKNWIGILVCFIIAVPSWLIGKRFPVVGGPIIAILAGMLIALVWTDKGKAEAGIKWTSKIFALCGRRAFTTAGPIVMLGTKCPSITST